MIFESLVVTIDLTEDFHGRVVGRVVIDLTEDEEATLVDPATDEETAVADDDTEMLDTFQVNMSQFDEEEQDMLDSLLEDM